MRAFTFALAVLAAVAVSGVSVVLGQQSEATRRLARVPAPVGQAGRVEPLYTASHALMVGVSKYDQPTVWPNLESVPGELKELKAALLGLGFDTVEELANPTGSELRRGIEGFIARHGYVPGARLVFFFSGHGYTLDGGRRGYFVPRDAPDPTSNEAGFRSVALSMDQVLTWARDVTARHVLFAFDSCFSGTVFRSREASVPRPISELTGKKVRQFLSAGDAGEPVPARSVFTPTFARALRGDADLDHDGFITGTELGNWVQRQVLSYRTGQTPQFGKLRDQDFDEGDLVFMVPRAAVPEPVTTPLALTSGASDSELGRREERALGRDQGHRQRQGHRRLLAAVSFGPLQRRGARPGGETASRGTRSNDSSARAGGQHGPDLGRRDLTGDLANVSVEALAAECARDNWAACSESALRYANGRGVVKDQARGATLFQRACEGGDARGCNGWGQSFEWGWGVTKNEARAAELYQRACEGGRALGCSRLGRLYDKGRGVSNDDARALALYQRGCDGGDPEGCSGVGLMTELGRAVAKDEPRAVGLYLQGCDGGDPIGCVNLGRMNRFGIGVPKDEPRALSSLQRACELGDPRGCTDWGSMQQFGRGVPASDERAAGLYQRGCDGGDGAGCSNLGAMYQFGRGVPQDFTRAADAYQRACDGGDGTGCVSLAEQYRSGAGVAKDEARALGLFRKGCDAGSARGCTQTGMMYRDGRSVAKDPASAQKHFRRGCDGGDILGCASAGVSVLPTGLLKVTVVNRETRDTTFSSNALRGTPLSYRVRGGTLTLRLPDGGLVVVDCDSKYALKGDYINQRSCRLPSVDQIQVEFERDDAKLVWPVSADGKRTESETYNVLSFVKKP